MLKALSCALVAGLCLAQAPSSAPPSSQEISIPQAIRPLPGKLNTIPVFNSNSPELVLNEGILLSTFPPTGKQVPTAHLNFPFQGRFDVFAHHIARADNPTDLRSLYLGILLHNPGTQSVTVDVLQAASYLSQPDAPFIELPPQVENDQGTVYAGPGDRAMLDVLQGKRQELFPPQIVIPPGESRMLMNLPIPVRGLVPPLNGRSSLLRLRSSDRIYAASLALFARTNPDGSERPPTLEEWQTLLDTGNLSSPRDRTPTPLDQTSGAVIYGRVAGVAQGTVWSTNLTNPPTSPDFTLPAPGQSISYGLSTLHRGTLGTGQIQSAPMLVRYPDTAYQAHGNYGIQYSLRLPLHNPTDQPQTVAIRVQTPLKTDQSASGLRFLVPPARQVFFRGTVRLRYNDDQGRPQTRHIHLVQRRGQLGEPLVTLNLKPGDRRLVEVDFLYPPDASPPQVLTVTSLKTP